MAKRELLKLPGTFEEALAGLLQTPPASPTKGAKRKPIQKKKRKQKSG